MPQRNWLITGVSSGFGRIMTEQLFSLRLQVSAGPPMLRVWRRCSRSKSRGH
jgi:hypothetical protein